MSTSTSYKPASLRGLDTLWNDTGYTETSRADDEQTRGDVWCDLRSLIPRSAVYADTS